jgi:hypothetical protein
MTTHIVSIYHCIECGRVVHAESELEPPHCCGHPMVEACEEMVCDEEVGVDESEIGSDVVQSAQHPPKKPH